MGSAAGEGLERSPGSTAESRARASPVHRARPVKAHPSMLPLVGLGLTVGNEGLGDSVHPRLSLQILSPNS